jgi:curved DNA-binding protein
MKFKDYYEAMGIERNATPQEIKQAYRKLARLYHPDISKDPKGSEKFQEVGEAYAVLKDPEKRAAYDQLGKQPVGEQFTPPPDWQQQFHTGQTGSDNVDLSDLFAAFGEARHGNRSARRNMQTRGQDYEISAHVLLEQLYGGEMVEVRAELPELDQNGLQHYVTRTFRVTIPVGASDGQRLRLTGKGAQSSNGGSAGDLYVVLALQPHALYRVSGHDLYLDLPLAPWEAILGATIKIPTLGGTVELTIKPSTVGGQHLRLAKRGLKAANGTIGALYAVVNIVLPNVVTAEEHKLFEKLAEISVFHPRQYFPV